MVCGRIRSKCTTLLFGPPPDGSLVQPPCQQAVRLRALACACWAKGSGFLQGLGFRDLESNHVQRPAEEARGRQANFAETTGCAGSAFLAQKLAQMVAGFLRDHLGNQYTHETALYPQP